jgi:hypothetical protein
LDVLSLFINKVCKSFSFLLTIFYKFLYGSKIESQTLDLVPERQDRLHEAQDIR